MKKKIGLLTLVATFLVAIIFTGCKEPESYMGKYYNTEFVSYISAAEFKEYWVNTTLEKKQEHIATWSTKSGYEKKTELKDYQLSDYLKSKWFFNDADINKCFDKLDQGSVWQAYDFTGGNLGNNHNILVVTLVK